MYKKIFLSCIVITVLSVGLRSILPKDTHVHQQDSRGYVSLAQEIHTNGIFSLGNLPPVAVGYPYFLSRLMYLPGSLELWVFIVQICFVLSTVGLIYFLARDLLDGEVANLAALLCSINCGFLTYVHCCLTETLLTFLYTAFLYCMICFFKKPTYLKALFAGSLLGFSLWIKPAAWLFGWYLIFIGCVLSFFVKDFLVKNIIYFSLGFLFFAGTNLLFNYYLFGALAFPPVMYTNLYYLFLPKILAATRDISYDGAIAVAHEMSGVQQAALLMHTLQEYPSVACWIWIQNMVKTIYGLFGANLVLLADAAHQATISFFMLSGGIFECIATYCWNPNVPIFLNIITCFDALWMGIRWVFFLPGVILVYRNVSSSTIYFLVNFLAYFIAITGADGCARLRMMTEPVFILITAAGIIFFLRGIPARY